MSEREQTMVIENLAGMEPEDRSFLLGVMAGIAAKSKGSECCGRCRGGESCAEGAADGGGQEGGAGQEGGTR